MPNGVEVNLPGGIGGKAYGSTVLILLGFLAVGAAIVVQGYMLRAAIHEQTTHFNEKVRDMNHEIERTCGKRGP